MTLRKAGQSEKPLAGTKIIGCVHITSHMAVSASVSALSDSHVEMLFYSLEVDQDQFTCSVLFINKLDLIIKSPPMLIFTEVFCTSHKT